MLKRLSSHRGHARALPLVGEQGSTALVCGDSHLGLAGWLVARIEPRLRFAVLTTPIASLERAVMDLPFCEPVRRGLQGRSLDLAG